MRQLIWKTFIGFINYFVIKIFLILDQCQFQSSFGNRKGGLAKLNQYEEIKDNFKQP
jgi:hypothetical protein